MKQGKLITARPWSETDDDNKGFERPHRRSAKRKYYGDISSYELIRCTLIACVETVYVMLAILASRLGKTALAFFVVKLPVQDNKSKQKNALPRDNVTKKELNSNDDFWQCNSSGNYNPVYDAMSSNYNQPSRRETSSPYRSTISRQNLKTPRRQTVNNYSKSSSVTMVRSPEPDGTRGIGSRGTSTATLADYRGFEVTRQPEPRYPHSRRTRQPATTIYSSDGSYNQNLQMVVDRKRSLQVARERSVKEGDAIFDNVANKISTPVLIPEVNHHIYMDSKENTKRRITLKNMDSYFNEDILATRVQQPNCNRSLRTLTCKGNDAINIRPSILKNSRHRPDTR